MLVELDLGGKCLNVEGVAQYDPCELRIPIQDPGGDFDLILHDATWDGTITDAPDGNGFLIRLRHQPRIDPGSGATAPPPQ